MSDTGKGISKQGQQKLFSEFAKLEEHENINQKGIGLGLSICKKISKQMGGWVSFSSEENVGSTFTFGIELVDWRENDRPLIKSRSIPIDSNLDINKLQRTKER